MDATRDFDFEFTDYGFRWGPMYVTRMYSDKDGGVRLLVSNSENHWEGKGVEVRISPKGRVVEWEARPRPKEPAKSEE